MASTKMVVGLRVDVDFTEVDAGHEPPPWVDMTTLDQSKFACVVQDTVYQNSKIEIICPDDYLDLTILNPELSGHSQLTAINDFASIFLEQSMKRRKGCLVGVANHWEAISGQSHPTLRAPPCWMFFIIKGSTELTTGIWLSHFLLLMGVRRAVYDKKSDRSPIGRWLPVFKAAAEDCFGVKLRDSVLVGRIL